MGYPSPLKVISRKLTNDIVIASCAFSRFDKLNFGGRMALINHLGQIIVWSALPYGPEVEKSLELLTGTTGKYNITHLIIPDKEHTMAAKSFKDVYPELKVIAMEGVEVPGLTIDYRVTSKLGNKTIDLKILKEELGITDKVFLDLFEFVYLPHHGNKELVMFDTKSKILFEADLLFNLGVKEPLEQYSPSTGFSEGYNPHSGWSFLTRYMQPYSKVGNILTNKITTPQSKPGLEAIQKWDFSKIVMCHGNIIEKDAKKAFANVFKV
ncbi:uncharacterized protein CANTADRAFT_25394 [Suhomyces tanzawaensis NRRL Y-17324]|uniref:Metallo-beta-lactamase domain-containing protein n=1 Tax=Suhomyces tanzawaensis NRRL Y-17324 TaxID=984487 RepID=A0A1E4SNU8_9ASCO|nr:uncharacterized protein CANTADRAFT_25394 [Suhomyces tanzawaensis NRRL Y-17324]ODV81166.1 hypothetical protein CANTADRAFT_25394 [Suhomyces tanzawaensis NRRL Y-17324]